MGLGPSKEKIRKILERSITNPNMNEQKNLKIEYKFNLKESLEAEENSTNMTNAVSNDNSENDSFYFSTDLTMTLNNPKLNVKNTKKFPYITIGTISVTFPATKKSNGKMFLFKAKIMQKIKEKKIKIKQKKNL